MRISEFLAARFAEEEAEVQAWAGADAGSSDVIERVLSDLKTKRLVVSSLVEYEQLARDGKDAADREMAENRVPGLGVACVVLAQPYSWHGDFDQDWLT